MRIFYVLTLIAFGSILMSNSCEKEAEAINQTETPVESNNKPDKLHFRFKGTTDKWKAVDSLEREGLYRSALEIVNEIYTAEFKNENIPQVIKATMYRLKYNSYLEEEDFVKALAQLDELVKTQKFPLKQIAHSITADAYWQFYQANRYRFLNRSETVKFDQNDVRTWNLNKILDHCRMHYVLSVENPDSLFGTDIVDFTDMLVIGNETPIRRPTLLDLLGHRALDHLQNDETGLSQAIDHYRIRGNAFFAEDKTFSSTNLTDTREATNLSIAVEIYQTLTATHLNDKRPEARIDLLIKRLNFVRRQSIDEQKDELYVTALNTALQLFEDHPAKAELSYQLAYYYYVRGNNYSKENSEVRWDKKRALEICGETMAKYPDSFGSKQCKNLTASIKQHMLTLQAEESYAPGEKGKFLVEYKNLDSLYFRLVEIPANYFLEERRYGKEMLADLLSKKAIQSWSFLVGNPGDYQMHSIELPMTLPEKGHYVLITSPRKDFSVSSNGIAYAEIWSTHLSYTYRNTDKEAIELLVNDRFTGKAIPGVKVNTLTQKYDYVSRSNVIKQQESYTTDKNGMVVIGSKSDYRHIYVDLQHGDDRYNNAYQIYQYRPYRDSKTKHSTHFFSDRSIYRPGQTVYFKGIRLKHDDNEHSIEVGKKVSASLFDVNGELVMSQEFVTNEFGTFSGSFKLPEGLLNGQMRIQDEYGSKWFSVEEYKRPRFSVEMLPVEGEYRLDDDVTVSGKATAYAGSTIDGAKVSYRITRGCNFPYYRWYRGVYPHVPLTEIAFGTVETDESGKFEITFKAQDDPTVKRSLQPTFYYTVHVDVTDINGETRSTESWVSVGYNCLNLSLHLPDQIEKNGKHKYPLNALNLNGAKLPTTGVITIQKVIENDRVMRSRLWKSPDIQHFKREEFEISFPIDAYENELDVTELPLSETLVRVNFDSEKMDSVKLSELKTLDPGRYKVVGSAIDPYGEKVEDIHYITIYDRKQTEAPTKEIWTITPIKTHAEPGEFAEIMISSATELHVLYEIETRNKITVREWINLNGTQKLIRIPITEEHRGNIAVHLRAVKSGREYTENLSVHVPYSNKELDIEFETFRDKLQPGEKEKWRVTIKGPKGEKIAAEMLVTMYDASLDAFASNSFYFNVFNSFYTRRYWGTNSFGPSHSTLIQENWNPYAIMPHHEYYRLNNWGFSGYYSRNYHYDGLYDSYDVDEAEIIEFADAEEPASVTRTATGATLGGAKGDRSMVAEEKNLEQSSDKDYRGDNNFQGKLENGLSGEMANITVRSNFNETAFFYPDLKTNEKGEIVIEFTSPESLTKWKILGLAHTKDLKSGVIQKELVTQKELMILSNAPRFLREGDTLQFSAKLSNLSEKELYGSAVLQLIDPKTDKVLNELFSNVESSKSFTVKEGQSTELKWRLEVPFGLETVKYKIVAKAGNFSDGEEMILPILSNLMLVTESLPLALRGTETKQYRFEKLISSGSSTSLKHHMLTLEYTANPAWYAVQAMPYMMEYPYECAEQVFTRYYANAISAEIMNSNPKIKEVFEQWENESPESLLSNLEKNQELKSLLLEETPWVFEAHDESERKKRIGLLFNMSKMNRELNKAMRKLQQMQVRNGGWPWFKGMEESRYITQHVVTGMGHLDALGVKDVRENNDTWNMLYDAVHYLDMRIKEDYDWIRTHYTDYKSTQHINSTQVQYLYARSYFPDIELSSSCKEAVAYFEEQANTYWKSFNLYNEGMIALYAHRDGNTILAQKIMASLKERSISDEEIGIYWKDNVLGYYWYDAPIETQALMIEAFDEITDDQDLVEGLKVWLLKQKQTTDWKTTKATAEACYALLRRGTDLLTESGDYEINLGSIKIDKSSPLVQAEAGTGYFKTSWTGEDVKPEMGEITISRNGEGISWGAIYWQYFEDLDKITPHETPLSLKKELFRVVNTASEPVIEPISGVSDLQRGDRIRVRIELRSDRNMEYLHLKDMRASGLEPVNVFSGHRWQDGLSYYESTKDAATNFFIEYLQKGTFVFEYDLIVSHDGNFSNGISSIQCMYAPECTSHSRGVRIEVGKIAK